jgi:hypothetical protein
MSTCKEEECPETCAEDESIAELHDWFFYDEGSYWIYEEENSGALDTVTVYDAWRGADPDGEEGFIWHSYSSYFDYDFTYIFHDSFSRSCAIGNCQCKRVERSKSRPGDFVGADYIFHSPVFVGNWGTLDDGAVVTVTDRLDSLTLNNHIFTNVFRHHATEDDSEGDQEVVYFIGRHFGIIKKELIDENQVWNLIDYEIIQ